MNIWIAIPRYAQGVLSLSFFFLKMNALVAIKQKTLYMFVALQRCHFIRSASLPVWKITANMLTFTHMYKSFLASIKLRDLTPFNINYYLFLILVFQPNMFSLLFNAKFPDKITYVGSKGSCRWQMTECLFIRVLDVKIVFSSLLPDYLWTKVEWILVKVFTLPCPGQSRGIYNRLVPGALLFVCILCKIFMFPNRSVTIDHSTLAEN